MTLAAPGFGDDFLAQFEIRGELSAGGMGVVYRARQRSLDREVAVKFPLLADPELLARFEAEARILASLDHPGVVKVYAWGLTQARPYLVEELIEGESLRECLTARGKFGLADAFRIGRDIADALGYIHSRDLVHRDLKPSNVLLGRERARLIDFGIARDLSGQRRTQAGVILGTPEYLAPEAVDPQPLGPPADIYAFGTLMFEMLTGELPLPAGDLVSMVRRRAQEIAPTVTSLRPGVSGAVSEWIAATLDRDPARRPTAAQLIVRLTDELSDLLGVSLGVSDPSWLPEPPSPRASERRASGAASARSAVTSYSGIRSARGASADRHAPASGGTSAIVVTKPRLPLGLLALAALGLAGAGLVIGLVAGRGLHGREAIPQLAEVQPADSPPPRAVDARRQSALERLAVTAETAATEASRLLAYYRLLAAVNEAGADGAAIVPAARLEPIRSSLVREDDRSAAILLKLVESAGPETPLDVRRLAAEDAVGRHARKTAATALEWLRTTDPRSRAAELGRRLKDDKDRTPAGLKAAARELLATPGGRFWEAVQPLVPKLLESSAVAIETRRELASILTGARGMELLFERYKLAPPIAPAIALAGVVTSGARPLGSKLTRNAPIADLMKLAGLGGHGADLLVNKKGEEDYLYHDAGAWYIAALGAETTVQDLKENDVMKSVRLPPAGTPPGPATLTFIARTDDLDPEDSLLLALGPAGGGASLELLFTRPDVDGPIDDTVLCTVEVAPCLLPPGEYTARVQANRLLMQRRFLESATRMRARLQRLSVAAVPAKRG